MDGEPRGNGIDAQRGPVVEREVGRGLERLACGPGAVEADSDNAHANVLAIATERSPAKLGVGGAAEPWRGNRHRTWGISRQPVDHRTRNDPPDRTAMRRPENDEIGLMGPGQLHQVLAIFGGGGGDDHLGTVGPGKNLTQLERILPLLGLLVADENPAVHVRLPPFARCDGRFL